jgi:hypothetical protein
MASITELTRCAGLNHYHFTMKTGPNGTGETVNLTIDAADLNITPTLEPAFVQNRIALMIREAKAAGNTTYAQIRTYLLNREFTP